MKTLTLALAAGATALFATAASAAPLSIGPVASDSNIQNVRMVCNEDGRCWRERGERRVIIREIRVTRMAMRRARAITSAAAMKRASPVLESVRPASASVSVAVVIEPTHYD